MCTSGIKEKERDKERGKELPPPSPPPPPKKEKDLSLFPPFPRLHLGPVFTRKKVFPSSLFSVWVINYTRMHLFFPPPPLFHTKKASLKWSGREAPFSLSPQQNGVVSGNSHPALPKIFLLVSYTQPISVSLGAHSRWGH